MTDIRFDLTKTVGKVKPVHGVNAGPECKVFTYDAKPWFIKAHIPLCRLHDTEYPYGSGEFVDIPCVFKNFDADENDPASYNFALTDEYIERILRVGAKPIYRLGVSIEHAPVPRHTAPPKDFAKWARICEHVIRHYNEGWASGHHWDLRYWEIWNEADGSNPQAVWNGTAEQFYELYCVTARHLKQCFPDLMIGGPAFTRAKNTFTVGFFEYLKAQPDKVPMDFYSWHRYFGEMDKLKTEIVCSRELLETYGYTDAENVVDEWNYMEDWKKQYESYPKLIGMRGAAFCAATLITLQQSPVDAACYFEADPVKEWCGIFEVDKMAIGRNNFATLKPRRPYAAFRIFGEMYVLGKETVSAVSDDSGCVYAMGAVNGDGNLFTGMVASFGGDPGTVKIDLHGIPSSGALVTVRRLNAQTDIGDDGKMDEIASFTACGSTLLTLPMGSDEILRIQISKA